MVIKLYKCGSDPRCVDKTLTDELVVSGTARDPLDTVNPILTIQGAATGHMLEGYNYMYIEDYARYYFVTIEPDSYDLNTVRGRCDILSSAKTWLRARTAIIKRNEKLYNAYLTDPDFNAYAYTNIVTKAFSSGLNGDSIILMTVG